jgi:hypothetical protein
MGQIFMQSSAIRQKLKNGSGVRFNVVGDGKTWTFAITQGTTVTESAYSTTVKTKKNKVVVIDIPYSKLKQTWGTKAAFNKNNIYQLTFSRDPSNGSDTSTIKVFDFEIY